MSIPRIIPRSEHCISRDNIDENALKVLYRLHKAGYRALLVGGGVRDLLLNKTPKDFDVATDAKPEEVKKLFSNCRLIGRRFRLAHVFFGREIIEVATFRGDGSGDQQLDESGRILRDNVYGSLEEDVWRRDFTVNALYYDIADFSVVDYAGAMEDIQQRVLRLIGDPELRYREDPVRMLRAVRFAAKLDFSIHPASEQPIFELGELLADIPPARLYEEVLKIFHSGQGQKAFSLMRHYGLLKYLFPQTGAYLNRGETWFEDFLSATLGNTDKRINQDKPVTPAFLFAAMLWGPVLARVEQMQQQEQAPLALAMQHAMTEVLHSQVQSIAIPRRFSTVIRDIWSLQHRFKYRKGRRAGALLEHPKFRAAYDFMCLRAQVGQLKDDSCEWWTQVQSLPPDELEVQFKTRGPQAEPSRPRKKRVWH